MKSKKQILLAFTVAILLLFGLFFLSINLGSLKVGFGQLLRGLFLEYDADVATVYDLRFPRILICIMAGAALAAAGVLMQSVLKNPIADPGIIGISSGASTVAVLISACFPQYFFLMPLFAFLGGMLAFVIVYTLAWNGGLSPLRILLIGVAVQAMFSGVASALGTIMGENLSGVASIVNGNITMKTWSDVNTLFWYVLVGLTLALVFAGRCNLLSLSDNTAKSLGVPVDRWRLSLSVVAVLLASISTAIVGVIGFLGLIVPHIARMIVGTDHKVLLPFSMVSGAVLLLLADTIGRTAAAPYEIPAAVLMALCGGPFFIFLLKRSGKKYAG